MSRNTGAIVDILTTANITQQQNNVVGRVDFQYNTLDDIITNIRQRELNTQVELSIGLLEKVEEETHSQGYITPFFDKAKELIERAKELDRRIKKIITTVETHPEGASFDFCNYNYRIKSLNSLVRKLLFDFLEKRYANDFNRFKQDTDLITNIRTFLSGDLKIKDIYRFSYILSNNMTVFKSQFIQILEHLRDRSIFTKTIKNSFLSGNSYKDIKVFAYYTEFPEQLFEIQFQTKQTSQIKFIAHEIYESVRTNVSCSPDMVRKRRSELQKCINLYNTIPEIRLMREQFQRFAEPGGRVELEEKKNNKDTIVCASASRSSRSSASRTSQQASVAPAATVARGHRRTKRKRKTKRRRRN